ncbi:MAG: hypothetical protein IJ033_05550 [Clostridia bacterium]|nr:hypothetical protein [Clostridia bacterium]
MKKKILLVLLVVLMVGILAFSVFACNNNDKDKDKDKDKTPVVDDGGDDDDVDDTDYLTPMLTDVIGAIDNTIANINDIEDAASVSATIYVDVVAEGKEYNVKLDIAGSIDQGAKSKNWAQIDASVLGVEVSLFAVNNGEVEDLYIAQNILNEEKQWNKLSQFEQANALSNLACNGIIDAVADLLDNDVKDDEGKSTGVTVGDKIDKGLVNGYAGGILPMLGLLGDLFVPAEGAAVNFATDDGYAAAINVNAISGLLTSLGSVLSQLPAEYHGLIETVVGVLLGGELDLSAGSFTAGSEEETPTIELAFGVDEDKQFTGLELSYALPDLSVEFGIVNLSLSGESKSYKAPFGSTEPEELAINLGLDLTLGALDCGSAQLDLNVYPNVSMSFDEDGYVDLDLSKLYAEVIFTFQEENWDGSLVTVPITVAQYNADGYEDLYLDLNRVAYLLGAYNIDESYFVIPVNLQEKFDNMIAEKKIADKQGDVSAENAIGGKNVIDYVIADVIPGLFNEDGSFNIGGLLGVVGQVPAIIEEVKPLLDNITTSEGSVTINLETLIAELIADEGIIGGSTQAKFGLYTGEGNVKAEKTLAEIMAPDAVLDNIAGLVNALVYESAVAEADRETRTYADYYADADRLLTADEIIGLVADFTGATLSKTNAYDNMSITLGGHAQSGIGAYVNATLGADDQTAEVKLAIDANIIENTTTYPSPIYYSESNGYYVAEDGSVVEVSTNTSKDGGKLLLNVVKKIFNGIVSDESFELDTFDMSYNVAVESEATGLGNDPIVITANGEYLVPASEWGTHYKYELAANTKVVVKNVHGIEAVVASYAHPMTGMTQFQAEVVFAEDVEEGSFIVCPFGNIILQVMCAEGIETGVLEIETVAQGSVGDYPYVLALEENKASIEVKAGTTEYYAIDVASAGTITLAIAEGASEAFQAGQAGLSPWGNYAILENAEVVGDNYGTVSSSANITVTEAGTILIMVQGWEASEINVTFAPAA